MLHGRTGPFGSAAVRAERFDAGSLSTRHQLWGRFWAEHGYVAIHVDSFTPRGYGKGFAKGSINSRPPEVSANFARPKDAYGALRYLVTRADVVSRGVMFRAAIAQYPGCGIESNNPPRTISIPLLLTVAGNDDEVSPFRCQQLAARMMNQGATVRFLWFEGASRGYDSPDAKTQSVDANRQALERTMAEAKVFFSLHLKE
jgi:carboxymethylenebutenolidase